MIKPLTPSHLQVGLVDQRPEVGLLLFDGLRHLELGVLPVLDVSAARADCGLTVQAVETQGLA